jgi:hypothetical protein
LIAPAVTAGWRKAFFVRAGALCAVRSLPPGHGARLEINAGLAIARHIPRSCEPLTGEQAEDMLLLGGFIGRPRPELTVFPLDTEQLSSNELG